jgi:AcrR family transcriptional regulator
VTAARIPFDIADATLLAVHEHGIDELSFEHVARHADAPVRYVARLAATPRALAAAAMEQSYEEWRDQVPAWLPIPEGGSLAEGLTAILRDTFRGLEKPGFLKLGHLLMLQAHPGDEMDTDPRPEPSLATGIGPDTAEDPRTRFLTFRARAEDEFTAWFRHAIERDPSIPPQPEGTDRTCARLVLLAIDGFVTSHRIEGDADADAYRAMLVEVVVSALRTV